MVKGKMKTAALHLSKSLRVVKQVKQLFNKYTLSSYPITSTFTTALKSSPFRLPRLQEISHLDRVIEGEVTLALPLPWPQPLTPALASAVAYPLTCHSLASCDLLCIHIDIPIHVSKL
jgi:hypothetical protein